MFSRRTASIIGLFVATLSWGASFFLVKKATAEAGVWPFLTYRFVVATLLMAAIFPKKFARPTKSLLTGGAALGFLLFLAIWTQTVGLQMTTATRSGFLTALYVPFTPLVGWVLLRQKVHLRQVAVACAAVAGLYVLTDGGNLGGGFREWWRDINPGDLWTLATALVSAAHIVATEKFSRREDDSLALGMWQFAWCTLWIFLADGLKAAGGPWRAPAGWAVWNWPLFAAASVVFNALFSTCFGFIMQIVAQKTIGSLKAALIFALEAPFSSGFAYAFLGEVMSARELTGAAIVFLTSIIPEAWLKIPER